MSKNARTIQVHTNNPVSSDELHDHIYHGVVRIDMEDALMLFDADDKIITAYQDHAWSSWNVVPQPDKPKSTSPHLQWSTGVDMEDGKGTPITTKIEQQRDHLGRFTKRK